MRTRAQNRCYRIFLVWWRFGSSWLSQTRRNLRQNYHLTASARTQLDRPQGASLSQFKFLNRQNVYLRPDPARVVVRPFKPATEPRDLNPTDKVRANHIVGRVLRLDAEASAQQLSEDATWPDRGLFSQRILVRSLGLIQSKYRPASGPDGRAGTWLPIHPEPSRRWRRAYFVAHVPFRHHRCGWQRIRRSDRSSRVRSHHSKPDAHVQWR
jgi:hypothetical protein